jgi:hypothetical protein
MKARKMFDTLAYSKKLVEAGMDAQTAEALAELNGDVYHDLAEEQLITKQDIKDIRNDISSFKKDVSNEFISVRNEINSSKNELKSDMKSEMKDLEYRLYYFVIKTATTIVGILGAIQTLFHFWK